MIILVGSPPPACSYTAAFSVCVVVVYNRRFGGRQEREEGGVG